MDLFRPFNPKVIAMKWADTFKLMYGLVVGKFRTEEEISAEVHRIRVKWGLEEA